jgi:hypothetical protein
MTRKRHLRCAVCGQDAGRWHQFHNQDTGWGICRRCVDWIKNDRQHPIEVDEFERTYGKPGVNYEGQP